MAEDPIIEIKIVTKEEVEAKMGMKIPHSLGDNEIIMAGGDEPITSELAALFEKAGMKVMRKIVKQIRLRNKIKKIIESCTSDDCPCYEEHIDTGYCEAQYQPSCNLGATFKVDNHGERMDEGEFPEDCPLEDAP